ncbi:hypothetical protein [Lysinibacillus parviboronicapiens]
MNLPIIAYQVSGEYSMVKKAALISLGHKPYLKPNVQE